MKRKMVFFDCDGTLIKGDLWPRLESAVGIRETVKSWLPELYSGKITFDQLLSRLSHAYKGRLTKQTFEEVMSTFSIFPESYEITSFLREKKIPMAIISSGSDYYVSQVAHQLEIPIYRSNTLMNFDTAGNFLSFVHVAPDEVAKVEQIKQICEEMELHPEETLFVGDSFNDIGAFNLTKHGVLYKNTHEELTKHCWKWIDNLNDIKLLL